MKEAGTSGLEGASAPARVTLMAGLAAAFWAGLATAACEPAELPSPVSNNVCDSPAGVPLPEALSETSGLAVSRTHEGVFWTHNDSGDEPLIFAIDSVGALLARVRVTGAANRDWEDMAAGPCGPGDARTCLFIGEIGDNDEKYPHVAVYRVPEPDPRADSATAPADVFRVTYPEGPRDAEGLFVTGAGVHLVSKGRSDAIELFRLDPPYRSGQTTALERVQRLAPPPTSVSAQVTAAAADAGGTRVVLRTYSGLRFFEVEGDTLRAFGRAADLMAQSQGQGEAVDFITGERLLLTSEAGGGVRASLAFATCNPLRDPVDTAAGPP